MRRVNASVTPENAEAVANFKSSVVVQLMHLATLTRTLRMNEMTGTNMLSEALDVLGPEGFFEAMGGLAEYRRTCRTGWGRSGDELRERSTPSPERG